jgi:malonyl-CoA O-methyltransferase
MMPPNPAIRRAFARAAAKYAGAAHFQREIGQRLRDGLPAATVPGLTLDAGCGNGHGGALIRERWPEARVINLDFALPMVRQLTAGERRLAICADATAIPLADASIDLFWSNLTLQWCDPARFLGEAARLLRPDGMLALSTLGPGTFAELRAAFAGADAYRHTIGFQSESDLAAALEAAGMQLLALKRLPVTRFHDSLQPLLGEVRDIGANTVGGSGARPGLMGKSAWRRFELGYEKLRRPEGLPLSYETLIVYARK